MQKKRCIRPSSASVLAGTDIAAFFVDQYFNDEAPKGSIAVVLRLYKSKVVEKERLLRRWSRFWLSSSCKSADFVYRQNTRKRRGILKFIFRVCQTR
jgi:hypothetical protein